MIFKNFELHMLLPDIKIKRNNTAGTIVFIIFCAFAIKTWETVHVSFAMFVHLSAACNKLRIATQIFTKSDIG